tara:strand:- start:100 stop:321 length:222 start_codon:yes stop_codon:yes gene_type:complete
MMYEHKLEMDNYTGSITNVIVEFEADAPSSRNPEVNGIYYLESDEPLSNDDISYLFEWLERDSSKWQPISHNK